MKNSTVELIKHFLKSSIVLLQQFLHTFLPVLISVVFVANSKATAETVPIVVGLNADMSSGSAQAGIAIKRGILIAIDEINSSGGVRGRLLKLEVRNHRGIPARGKANMEGFNNNPSVIAVFGGLHTPVMLTEKKVLFDTGRIKIPYLTPWAAGTPVVNSPWIFRLSVRDEYAGPFLINKAMKRGYRRIALLLEQTPWGRSNESSMTSALKKRGLKPATVQWFPWKTDETRIAQKLEVIYKSQAEVIMVVANAPEGATIVKALAKRKNSKQLPLISHWGITGGNFTERAGDALNIVDLSFLQTYSFISDPGSRRNRKFLLLARKVFPIDIKKLEDIFSPVGTAHAYDLTHILARAIRKANGTKKSDIRMALETLGTYHGLVRTYNPPFRKGQGRAHDALDASDFQLSKYVFSKSHNRWLIMPAK